MPTAFAAPATPSPRTGTPLRLADFLDRFDDVVDESDGWVIPCPAHADGHPSLRVAVNATGDLMLHCRAGCGKAEVLSALGLRKAQLFNVDASGITVHAAAPTAPLSPASKSAVATYLTAAAAALVTDGVDALAYAARRFGITPAVAYRLGLGYDNGTVAIPDGMKLSRSSYQADARLVVPFRDFDGTPHGLQSRALSPTASVRWSGPLNPDDGSSWSKYGVFAGAAGLPDAVMLITEGPGDALTAAAAGFDAVCVRGASLAANVDLLDDLVRGLTGRRVVVAGDADAAGAKFVESVCDALSARAIDTYRITLPADTVDLTEWRESAPGTFPARFAAAVTNAEPYGEDEVLADRLIVESTHLLTDVFNAVALLDYIRSRGGDVRYTEEAGFMLYTGDDSGIWEVDPKGTAVRSYAQKSTPFIQRRVLDRVHGISTRVLQVKPGKTRTDLDAAIDKLRRKVSNAHNISWSMSSNGITAMLKELCSLEGVRARFTDFDTHPDVLAAANGVINLQTGALTPYGDETRLLYLTRKVAVPYKPGARNPRWVETVADIFRDYDGLAEYVQHLFGYGATGHTSESAVAVLYGAGSNGKGTLVEPINKIMRAYTAVTPFSTFVVQTQFNSSAPSPEVAAMAGARYVLASEGESGARLAEARLKNLTGGDEVSGRFLHKDGFSFTPACLVVLQTNHVPVVHGTDDGIWRRLKLIPFTRKYEGDGDDKFLKRKLKGETVPANAWLPTDDMGDGLSGILSWLVEGAQYWYANGLTEPAVVRSATREYRDTSDQLGDFISEKLVRDPSATIPGTQLFKLYGDWAEEESLSPKERWKRTTVYRAMQERHAVAYIRDGAKWLRGYRERTAADRHEDTDPGHSVLSAVRPSFTAPASTDPPIA